MHAFSILILLPATALALVVPPTVTTKTSFQTTPSLSRRAPEKAETLGPEPMAVGPNGVDPDYSADCPDGAAAGCNSPEGHFRERRRRHRRRRALQSPSTPSPQPEPASSTKATTVERDESPPVPGGLPESDSSPYRRRRALHAGPARGDKKPVKRYDTDDNGFDDEDGVNVDASPHLAADGTISGQKR